MGVPWGTVWLGALMGGGAGAAVVMADAHSLQVADGRAPATTCNGADATGQTQHATGQTQHATGQTQHATGTCNGMQQGRWLPRHRQGRITRRHTHGMARPVGAAASGEGP